jgi:hypothetical protein
VPAIPLDNALSRILQEWSARRAARRADFISKFDAYVHALTLAVMECVKAPPSTVSRSAVGRLLDKAAQAIDSLGSEATDELLSRLLFSGERKRGEELLSNLVKAQTSLVTIAPSYVRLEMKQAGEFVASWARSSLGCDLTAEWLVRRDALQRAADDYLAPAWKKPFRLARRLVRGRSKPHG